MKFSEVWDLSTLFSNGSQSSDFQRRWKETAHNLKTLKTAIEEKSFQASLPLSQEIDKELSEMEAFVECLLAQDVSDQKAFALMNQTRTLLTSFSNLLLELDASIGLLSKEGFEELLSKFPNLTFHINEKRKKAQKKLNFETEGLINDLAKNGYHGWSDIYSAAVGEMTFPFQGETFFFGQMENHLASPNRERRKEAFSSIQSGFSSRASSFAQILNHLGGFRLEMYEKRGWENILMDPLDENRMEEKTLDAMWSAIERFRPHLQTYLKCKSALLKTPSLNWYDLEAPLSSKPKEISYQEAAEMILKLFAKFSPQLTDFSKRALDQCWIEAEDREGKRPGGFCVRLPISKESRIFMTFSQTMTNLFTLAHELGHAFHNEVLFPLPDLDQKPPMALAETASTMAEMIVTQGAIQNETDPEQQLSLLDDHLSRTTSYLMNIQARFLFEKEFYAARKKGFVSHTHLSNLMEVAQKTAYGESLEIYYPLFWAAKMHFYFTNVPFYNFPYTFGYLFSLGIYTIAMERSDFESTYIALLKDTGRMMVEDLAMKHLRTDLTSPKFWEKGLAVLEKDINTYQDLSKQVK